MKKRIWIDATTVTTLVDGLSQYIINLLRNYPEEAFEEYDFSILVNKGTERKELHELFEKKPFKKIEVQIAPIGPKRDLGFWFFFRKHKKEFDVFHSISNQYPLSLKKGIATVCDITFKYYLDQPWWTFRMAQRYLDLVIRNALKKANFVIAISQATKDMLISSYHPNQAGQDKIRVVHLGWEHLIPDQSEAAAPPPVKFGRYLFYVGSTRRHKNMANLLEAFNIAKDKLPAGVNLVLTGNDTHVPALLKTINSINKDGQRVFFTGYVSKAELQALYENTDAFIFPSLCEGFGIPVLEAFYFKRPLICSNTTSLPEVAGDAALYFDPENPADMAAVIKKFYQDPSLEKSLVEKGTERLKKFSWKKTAEETIALYQEYFNH